MKQKNILTALLPLLWLAAPAVAQADDNDEDEPRLVRVEYRKDWYWKEAEYNLPLRYFPIVYRDRTYETGETFTDTFMDFGHVGGFGCMPSWGGWDGVEVDNERIGTKTVYYPWNYEIATDLYGGPAPNGWATTSTAVSDLSVIKTESTYSSNYNVLGSYGGYVVSKLYDEMGLDVPPTEGVEIVGSSGTSTRPTGWYFQDCTEYREYNYCSFDADFSRYSGFRSHIYCTFYDQYLVIDEQMISFNEPGIRGTIRFNQSERDVYLPGNIPAKIFKNEARRTFLGRDFYGYTIDTVFQYTGTPPAYPPSCRAPQHAPQQADAGVTPVLSPAPADRRADALRRDAPLVAIDDGQPKFIYGGKPKGRKGMF